MTQKEFKVRPAQFNLYEVYVEGGGKIPEELNARYTSPSIAETAIERYLSTRRDYPARGRTKKNATESS